MEYNLSWSQDYPGWEGQDLIKKLENMRDDLVEEILYHKEFDFPEAREVLAKVMAK